MTNFDKILIKFNICCQHLLKFNDVELFLLEEPVLPMEEMHIIWQRYFLFDIYDANGIESDQTLMVDADTIVHPDTPNFFEKMLCP